uniref:Uncharacterized protein n=1 Tax=Euplotes harpa TaxID=151035 RepID=A0A7S3JH46_9SPIT|mmetsp:Transcript_36952/g.42467  ORF Transcript_36952/g.42467 Transcript_36952/m.42467 type:complete len:211 (+) Transcript_36952:208-840(+)
MFRVLNWLFLTMMFLGKWEWGRITNNLPMATTLSLIATFIPDDFVNKYYRDNHLARAIILSHFLLSFAMCLIFNINSMREAYPDNPIMFAIAVYIAEGYCTAMVDTIERLIFERTFATANNVLFLCYYSPGVLGSMVYMYFIDPTMTAIDISSSIADLSSMMLRSFTFVTFMIVSYKDLQMLGFDKTVYPQFLKMIGMDKAGELAQKKIE